MGSVTGNHVVAGFDREDAGPNAFHNSTGFVAKNAGEEAFGIKTVERVDVGVTKRIGYNLDTNFASLGRVDGNLLANERSLRSTGHLGFEGAGGGKIFGVSRWSLSERK